MSRASRKAKIEALAAARGASEVLTYVTSTRKGLETEMAMDVIAPLYGHLQAIRARHDNPPQIDLFIHSYGGDGTVPWRLVSLIREFASTFNVLVPSHAYSAATLTALGADKVVMHPMGVLGPTDPTITTPLNPPNPQQPDKPLGISVEDVASYIALVRDDVGIRHEDELVQAFNTLSDKIHPLVLGNVKRSTSQSRMMGKKLLKLRGDDLKTHEIDELVEKLSSQLFYHGHPISRNEARNELGLTFVENASDAEEVAMWDLMMEYDGEMKLSVPLEPLLEAIALNPLPIPSSTQTFQQVPGGQAGQMMPVPPTPSEAMVSFDPLKTVYVESVDACDVYTSQMEARLVRNPTGDYACQPMIVSRGWATE